MSFGGLYKLFVHWFQHLEITLYDLLRSTSSLHGVTLYIADKTQVSISVHIDFEIHQVSQVLAIQSHDTLDDNHFARFDMNSFFQTV